MHHALHLLHCCHSLLACLSVFMLMHGCKLMVLVVMSPSLLHYEAVFPLWETGVLLEAVWSCKVAGA